MYGDGDIDATIVKQMQHACLAFCILGLLLTPFDILGTLGRTDGHHSFGMIASVFVLGLEDIPQLVLNFKYIGIMAAAGYNPDPISIMSLVASIGNIAYNVFLLMWECCTGKCE